MTKLLFVIAFFITTCCAAQDSTQYLEEYNRITSKINQEVNRQTLETLYISRGDLLLQRKKYDKAISDYFYAIQYGRSGSVLGVIGDKEHEALTGRGIAYLNLDKSDLAESDFSEALRLKPKNAFFFYLRGVAYKKHSKYKVAIEDFTSAIRLDNSKALYYGGRGAAWHELTQYDSALRDLSTAISLDSNDATFISDKGSAYYRKRMFDSAAVYHYKAYKKEKNDPYRLSYGILYENDIKYAKTIKKLEEVERFVAAGNYADAYKTCNEIIAIDSQRREAYYYRGILQAEQDKFAAAVRDLNKVKELEVVVLAPLYPIYSSRATFHNRLGNYYSRVGSLDAAIKSYSTAIHKDSTDPVFYNNRGLSYYYSYKTDSAYRDFKRAIRLDPNNHDAHHNLALCYSDRLQYDSVIIELEKNEAHHPVSTISLMNKLLAYYELQRRGLDLTKFTLSPGEQKNQLGTTSSIKSMNLPEEAVSYLQAANVQKDLYLTWQLLYLLQQEQYAKALVVYKQTAGASGLISMGAYGFPLNKYIEACTKYLTNNKTKEALGLLEIAVATFPRDSVKVMQKNGRSSLFANILMAAGKASESLGYLQHAQYYYKTASMYNPHGVMISQKINALEKKVEAARRADLKAPDVTFLYCASKQKDGISTLEIAGYTKDPSGIDAVLANGKAIKDFHAEWGWFVFTVNEPATHVTIDVVDKNKNKTTVVLQADDIHKLKDGNRKDQFHTILIACDDYKPYTGFKPLQYCTNEAIQLSTMLMYHYNFSRRDMVFLPNPSKTQMLQQIKLKLSQMTSNDNLLIFFSGHGTMVGDQQPVTCWVPPDAKGPMDYIRPTDLSNLLDSSQSKHVLIISDACYSGALQNPRSPTSAPKKTNAFSREVIAGSGYSESPERSELLQQIITILNENTSPLLTSRTLFQQLQRAMSGNKTSGPIVTPMWYSFTDESTATDGFYFKKIER